MHDKRIYMSEPQSGVRVSLGVKMFLLICIYTMTGLALLSMLLYGYIRDHYIGYFDAIFSMRVHQWEYHIVDELEQTDDVKRIGGSPAESGGGRLFRDIISRENVGIYEESGSRITELKGTVPLDMPPGLLKKEHVYSGHNIRFLHPFSHENKDFFLYVHLPLAEGLIVPDDIYTFLINVALIFTGLAFFLGFLLQRLVIRPVLNITKATRRVAAGDFEKSAIITSGDEIEDLSRNFHYMTEKVKEMQELARDASPLTGLPGNNSITRCIEDTIHREKKSVVLYIDIDNFKEYNDVYGFEAGDKAILYLAGILERNVENVDSEYAFLGHLGGDDFIAVLPEAVTDEFARTVCSEYDESIHTLYTDKDIKRGGIYAEDRQGNAEKFPLMSISLAGVHISSGRFRHFSEVASSAAEVKKAAKKEKGSSFVMDRRKGKPVRYKRRETH